MATHRYNKENHNRHNALRTVLAEMFFVKNRPDLASIVQGHSSGSTAQYEEIKRARVRFSSKHAAKRQARAKSGITIVPPPSKQPFDDSSENLQRIANAIPRTRVGVVRTPSSGSRKPSVMRERNENQKPGNEYARLNGVYVAVMDSEGFPDNLYLTPGNPVPFGVEWKASGKKPTPEQAQRILDLRRLGWVVRVFDSLEGFRVWLDGYLPSQVAA